MLTLGGIVVAVTSNAVILIKGVVVEVGMYQGLRLDDPKYQGWEVKPIHDYTHIKCRSVRMCVSGEYIGTTKGGLGDASTKGA